MGIRLFREEDRSRWDEYVGRSAVAACYHLAGWKDVIEKSFGHSAYYLLSESSDGETNGILPLIHLKSLLFGNFMISLPYLNYGGICADSDEIENRLFEEAISLADEKRAHHIEFRHTHHLRRALPSKTTKVSMRLGLLQGPG